MSVSTFGYLGVTVRRDEGRSAASRTVISNRSTNDSPHLVSSAGPVIHVLKPGATATEGDREAAKNYLGDIYTDFWNPWRQDDEAEAIQAARDVLDQWDETGGATREEIEAWRAARDEYYLQERRRRDNDRARRKKNYDPGQEDDRLALLEAESLLHHTKEELASMINGISLDGGR